MVILSGFTWKKMMNRLLRKEFLLVVFGSRFCLSVLVLVEVLACSSGSHCSSLSSNESGSFVSISMGDVTKTPSASDVENTGNRKQKQILTRHRVNRHSVDSQSISLLRLKESLESLDCLDRQGFPPDSVVYSSLLQLCGRSKALAEGKWVHAHIIRNGFNTDVFLDNHLIVMYNRCQTVVDARQVFDKMPIRNTVSWNAMIGGYAQHGYIEEAFELFEHMKQERVEANRITFINMLTACTRPESLALGKLVHDHIVDAGFESDVPVQNALINMYGKCGSIRDAREVFGNMRVRNVVSWTAMVAVCSTHGHVEEIFSLFQQMQQDDVKPNKITFVSILSACASPETLALGELVHASIVREGLESDAVVGNAIVNMYWKCGNIQKAQHMFHRMFKRDVISWNMMITAYSHLGYSEDAFKLFQQMQQEGAEPDKITFLSMLSACASSEMLTFGKLIHACIIYRCFESDVVVGTALFNMYAKCRSINDALGVFYKMHERDLVSWNAMIAAYIQHGHFKEAFELFQQMQQDGLEPDKITFINLLRACFSPDTLVLGKLIHAHVVDAGFEQDIGNALVSMYGKCGSIKDAVMVFDKMATRDVVLCTTMIAAYALHGHGKEALEIFHQMQREGMKPDKITFVSVLNACSHLGLVDKGLQYFKLMYQDHGHTPTVEHYNCIVDLLGRAGRLDEAEDFISRMPLKPDAVTWMTLLGSCRIHGCIDRGKRAAEYALELDPQSASAYVVLSNLYATAGRWDDAAIVRKLMSDRAVKESG